MLKVCRCVTELKNIITTHVKSDSEKYSCFPFCIEKKKYVISKWGRKAIFFKINIFVMNLEKIQFCDIMHKKVSGLIFCKSNFF